MNEEKTTSKQEKASPKAASEPTDAEKIEAADAEAAEAAEARELPEEAQAQQMTREEYDAIGKGKDYVPHTGDRGYGPGAPEQSTEA